MKKKIRIGTRESDLSIAQTMLAVEGMKKHYPDLEYEIVLKSTLGDRLIDQPLVNFGGKGVFVSELEQGILQGEIDFAVHSAKDLPMDLAEGLEIVSVLPRGDVRDVLVSLSESPAWEEGEGEIRIGTSSLRRKIQMEELGKKLWPGRQVVCENLRGSVITRLNKLDQGQFDGIILAAAGLERLNIPEVRKGRYRCRYFTPEEMIPAGGQGILAIEGRPQDPCSQIARAACDEEAMRQMKSERLLLRLLSAGCHQPVGVYCQTNAAGGLFLCGIYEQDGIVRRAAVSSGEFDEPEQRLAALLRGNEVEG